MTINPDVTNVDISTDDGIVAARARITSADEDWNNWDPAPADTADVRTIEALKFNDYGFTVRETLVLAYGTGWERHLTRYGIADVTKRTWYTYVTRPGKSYPDMVWHESDVIVLNCTMGRDVHGYEETVGVSNYRVLRDNWADVDGLTDGPYSGSSHISLDLDMPAPGDLVDVLERLESYPVLDDDAYNEVEQELIREHWESYGADDSADMVAECLGVDSDDLTRADLTDYAIGTIETLTFSGYLESYDGGPYWQGYPSFIDSSAVEFGATALAGWVRDNVGRHDSVTLRTYPGDTNPLIVDTRIASWVRG